MPKKVILISGGSDGVGKAIAQKLAPNNQVIILAHNKEKLQAVAKEIGCDYVEAELTDYESLKSAVNMVIERHRGLDVLINNAGIWMEGDLDESDSRKIKEIIDVNTTGTIYLTRAVLPGMKFRKSGQIVNIISQDGVSAKKSRSVYSASKWAITGFTKCLQEELEGQDIKVTGIYPGLVNTNLFEKSGVKRDLTNAMEPSEVADVVEYVINLSSSTYIPEVSIKNKLTQSKNMDNSDTSAIDLNIDPNMIAAQDDSPQLSGSTPAPVSAPTPPVKSSSVIDITPGSTDVFPSTPVSNHIDVTPLAEPKTFDITPPQVPSAALSHLSDISPDSTPESVSIPSLVPPLVPLSAANTPNPFSVEPTPSAPTSIPLQAAAPAVPETTQSSPLAEDPDLVKLIK